MTSIKDLPPGKMIGVEVGGKSVLVVNLAGKYYAIGNVCTHRGCLLSEGTLEGEIVQCGCHMSRFDVTSGNVVGGPAKKREPVFQVKLEANQILVKV